MRPPVKGGRVEPTRTGGSGSANDGAGVNDATKQTLTRRQIRDRARITTSSKVSPQPSSPSPLGTAPKASIREDALVEVTPSIRGQASKLGATHPTLALGSSSLTIAPAPKPTLSVEEVNTKLNQHGFPGLKGDGGAGLARGILPPFVVGDSSVSIMFDVSGDGGGLDDLDNKLAMTRRLLDAKVDTCVVSTEPGSPQSTRVHELSFKERPTKEAVGEILGGATIQSEGDFARGLAVLCNPESTDPQPFSDNFASENGARYVLKNFEVDWDSKSITLLRDDRASSPADASATSFEVSAGAESSSVGLGQAGVGDIALRSEGSTVEAGFIQELVSKPASGDAGEPTAGAPSMAELDGAMQSIQGALEFELSRNQRAGGTENTVTLETLEGELHDLHSVLVGLRDEKKLTRADGVNKRLSNIEDLKLRVERGKSKGGAGTKEAFMNYSRGDQASMKLVSEWVATTVPDGVTPCAIADVAHGKKIAGQGAAKAIAEERKTIAAILQKVHAGSTEPISEGDRKLLVGLLNLGEQGAMTYQGLGNSTGRRGENWSGGEVAPFGEMKTNLAALEHIYRHSAGLVVLKRVKPAAKVDFGAESKQVGGITIPNLKAATKAMKDHSSIWAEARNTIDYIVTIGNTENKEVSTTRNLMNAIADFDIQIGADEPGGPVMSIEKKGDCIMWETPDGQRKYWQPGRSRETRSGMRYDANGFKELWHEMNDAVVSGEGNKYSGLRSVNFASHFAPGWTANNVDIKAVGGGVFETGGFAAFRNKGKGKDSTSRLWTNPRQRDQGIIAMDAKPFKGHELNRWDTTVWKRGADTYVKTAVAHMYREVYEHKFGEPCDGVIKKDKMGAPQRQLYMKCVEQVQTCLTTLQEVAKSGERGTEASTIGQSALLGVKLTFNEAGEPDFEAESRIMDMAYAQGNCEAKNREGNEYSEDNIDSSGDEGNANSAMPKYQRLMLSLYALKTKGDLKKSIGKEALVEMAATEEGKRKSATGRKQEETWGDKGLGKAVSSAAKLAVKEAKVV